MQLSLKKHKFNTKLGPIIAIGDEKVLYLLEFTERKGLERELRRLQLHAKTEIIQGNTSTTSAIESEIKSYFKGNLKEFKTPFHVLGTEFQKTVWNELMRIPYGKTRSYLEQARSLGKQKSYRAVANANGANQMAIVIPCHRVINSNGNLGGYGGGIERKKFLLAHEKEFLS